MSACVTVKESSRPMLNLKSSHLNQLKEVEQNTSDESCSVMVSDLKQQVHNAATARSRASVWRALSKVFLLSKFNSACATWPDFWQRGGGNQTTFGAITPTSEHLMEARLNNRQKPGGNEIWCVYRITKMRNQVTSLSYIIYNIKASVMHVTATSRCCWYTQR